MEERRLPDEFLEKLIIKGLMNDSYYVASLSSVFKPSYFQDDNVGKIFNHVREHFKKYNTIPPKDVVINEIGNGVNETFQEVESIEYDLAKNFDHLFEETNLYLKEQSFKEALMEGVDLVEKKQNPLQYKHIVEEALSKDLKIDLGVDYWGTLQERLKRVMNQKDVLTPTGYPILDEFISGGFPTYTLSLFLSRIHGCKSNLLINMASRQVMKGWNPLILSLEMSEDSICQRLDSIYTKQDINRIYLDKNTSRKMVSGLTELKKNKKGQMGNLIVKEFPTGNATVSDFATFIRELNYRGIYPNPIYCDYLQLMKNEYNNGGKRHEDIKQISEGLRALSLRCSAPVISVSQLNRCLVLGTTVEEKKKGNINIEKLEEGDEVKSNNGYNKVIKVWPKETQKVYSVKTKSGHTIKCSENHLFPCYDQHGNFKGYKNIFEIVDEGLLLEVEKQK